MNLSESEIIRRALEWHEAGRDVAVGTVIETWGAGPRPVGSRLFVNGSGAFVGSVSGGCVEGDVVAEAIDLLASANCPPRLLEFGVSDGLAWKAGLTCGGTIRIFVERLDAPLAACLKRMMREFAARRPAVLVTGLDGSQPRVALNDAVADPLAPQVGEALRTGRSARADVGGESFFLGALVPPTRLVVFGAVHIAQALANLARVTGLEIIVVDPRTAFATPDRFTDTHLVTAWPNDAGAEIRLNRSDAVAAVSHDPKIDDEGLQLALQTGCFYVGALGSRRSHAKRLDRLRAAGVGEPDLQRIHAPIGLDIGAEGAPEIAVAILAEVISVQRRRRRDSAAAQAA